MNVGVKKRLAELDRSIGGAVKRARLEAGLSQSQLASCIGVQFQQVQKYESGRNRVAASTLCAIAEACGVTPAWLLAPQTEGTTTSVRETPSGAALAAFDDAKSPRDRLIDVIDNMQDLTRGLAEEAAFELALDFAGAAFSDLPVAIYVTDRHGIVRYSNEASADFAGRKPQIGVDRWCVTWRLWQTTGEFLPHENCPMAIALKENRVVRGAVAVAERPDGARQPFTPYPTPLRAAHNALIAGFNALVPAALGSPPVTMTPH